MIGALGGAHIAGLKLLKCYTHSQAGFYKELRIELDLCQLTTLSSDKAPFDDFGGEKDYKYGCK